MTLLSDRRVAAPETDEGIREDIRMGVRRATCRHCWQPITHINGAWAHAYNQIRCWQKDVQRKVLQEALNTIARLTVEHRIQDVEALRVLDNGHRFIAETYPS